MNESESPALGFLVLLYNRKAEDSETLQSLVRSIPALKHARCIVKILNNGPKHIDAAQSPIVDAIRHSNASVQIEERLDNLPLSVAYNRFIEEIACDRYVFLDQDTSISEDFLTALENHRDADLVLPMIVSHGSVQSPTVGSKPVTKTSEVSRENLMGIGSGIAIARPLVSDMRRQYGTVFDQRYALYGVDSTFFLRLRMLPASRRLRIVCDGRLLHSLSRLEKEDRHVKNFRGSERSYDLGISLRRYASLHLFKHFIKSIPGMLNGRNSLSLAKIVKAFTLGRHPRCKNW